MFCSGGIVYEMKLDTDNHKLSELKSLKGKYITKLTHGYRHCFAFERKTKLISDLNNN